MKRFADFLRNFQKDSNDYFSHSRDSIAQKNMLMLHRVNLCTLILLVVYLIITLIMFKNTALLLLYITFLILHTALLVFIVRYKRNSKSSYLMVQSACLVFIASILLFIILVSVFPYPNRPSIFFPLFYILMTMLFILPYRLINLFLTSFEAIFLILVYAFKGSAAVSYDSFGSYTAWVLGLFISFLVLDLHVREGKALVSLETVSSTDVTTGLYNRRAFDSYFQSHFKQNSGPFAVLLLDIDDFKHFNDTHGHLAGDSCLSIIGAALNSYAEEQGIFVARFGGEELIVVAIGNPALHAQEHADAIRQLVGDCATPLQNGAAVHVSASVGLFCGIPVTDGGPLDFIHWADAALYRAKAEGKNRVAYFQPEMDSFY